MDILSIILYLFWLIFSVVWWFLSFLFLPLFILLIILIIVLRFAYRSPYFKPYLDKKFKQIGAYGLDKFKAILYTITVVPFHVLLRFILLSVWHAIISLLWKPKWSPWERARKISKKRT